MRFGDLDGLDFEPLDGKGETPFLTTKPPVQSNTCMEGS